MPPGFHQTALASSATATKARPIPSERAPGAMRRDWAPASDCARAVPASPATRRSPRMADRMRLIRRPPWRYKTGTPKRPTRDLNSIEESGLIQALPAPGSLGPKSSADLGYSAGAGGLGGQFEEVHPNGHIFSLGIGSVPRDVVFPGFAVDVEIPDPTTRHGQDLHPDARGLVQPGVEKRISWERIRVVEDLVHRQGASG